MRHKHFIAGNGLQRQAVLIRVYANAALHGTEVLHCTRLLSGSQISALPLAPRGLEWWWFGVCSQLTLEPLLR